VLFALHGAGVALALSAALVWPRAGQAALMVPLAGRDTRTVIGWAAHEDTPLLALDTARGRIVARVTDNRSLLRALGQGILPLAVRAPGCRPKRER
jgi:hypothetical protein